MVQNNKPTLKHYELETENQELYVAMGEWDGQKLAEDIIKDLKSLPGLATYVKSEIIEHASSAVLDYNACYIYLGNQGRHAHLIYFKTSKPYTYQIGHELNHMMFQVMSIMSADVREAGVQEWFNVLWSYWFSKLTREIEQTDLPQIPTPKQQNY